VIVFENFALVIHVLVEIVRSIMSRLQSHSSAVQVEVRETTSSQARQLPRGLVIYFLQYQLHFGSKRSILASLAAHENLKSIFLQIDLLVDDRRLVEQNIFEDFELRVQPNALSLDGETRTHQYSVELLH
jgi:hypothetical protein